MVSSVSHQIRMILLDQVHISLNDIGLHLQYNLDVLDRCPVGHQHPNAFIVADILAHAGRCVACLAGDVTSILHDQLTLLVLR